MRCRVGLLQQNKRLEGDYKEVKAELARVLHLLDSERSNRLYCASLVGRLRLERQQSNMVYSTALFATVMGVSASDPHPARLAAAVMSLLKPLYQSRIDSLEEQLAAFSSR